MKKQLLLLFLLLCFCIQVNAQCSGGSLFSAINAPTGTAILPISTCNWAGDYNTINNCIAGTSYTFKTSSTALITIRQGSSNGPLVGYGTSTVTITSPILGSLYMLINTPSCGIGTNCITTTIQNNTTLPVSFGKFTASLQNKWAKLDWNTFSETNNQAFLLYRSTDGENYTQIAEQASKGNGANSYTIFDYYPANGTNYYRIKQKDVDGTLNLLADDAVSFSLDGKKIEIWPNPVDKLMRLGFTAGKYQHLSLTDINGRKLLTQNLSKTQSETKIDMSNRPKGVYVVELTGNNGTQIVKVVK